MDSNYNVYETATVMSWTDATEVFSSQPDSLCGTWSYEITQTDSSPLDTSVFTVDIVAKTFTIVTNDRNKESAYTVQVKATQGVYSAFAITKTFIVTVADLCDETATRTFINPGVLTDTTYSVYNTATVLTWTDASEITTDAPAYCGTWVYEVGSFLWDPLDSEVFTVNLDAKTLSIQTSDQSKENTYTV